MKKLSAFILTMVMLLLVIAPVTNASALDIESIENSKSPLWQTESCVTEVDYDYESGIYSVSVLEVSVLDVRVRGSGYVYKSATHSKYFYIISSGEKVAEYTLTANFRYDKDNELAECRSTSYTANSVVNKWTVSGASCVDNVTSALGAGRGDYSLYSSAKSKCLSLSE